MVKGWAHMLSDSKWLSVYVCKCLCKMMFKCKLAGCGTDETTSFWIFIVVKGKQVTQTCYCNRHHKVK